MLAYCRTINDGQRAVRFEQCIRELGMGDIQLASLPADTAPAPSIP